MPIKYLKSHKNTKIIYHFLQDHYPTQEKQSFLDEVQTYINNHISSTNKTILEKNIICTFNSKKTELDKMVNFMKIYEANLSYNGFSDFKKICIEGERFYTKDSTIGKTGMIKRLYSAIEKLSDDDYNRSVMLAKNYDLFIFKPTINFPEYQHISVNSIYADIIKRFFKQNGSFLLRVLPVILCLDDIKAQRSIFYRFYKGQKIKSVMVSMTWTEEESTHQHLAGTLPGKKAVYGWIDRAYVKIAQTIYGTFHK